MKSFDVYFAFIDHEGREHYEVETVEAEDAYVAVDTVRYGLEDDYGYANVYFEKVEETTNQC